MKRTLLCLLAMLSLTTILAQEPLRRPYDENIDPMQQIDDALKVARQSNRNVICQVGGNWCIWCLRFADFIEKDSTISEVIDQHYIYTHINYPRRGSTLGDITQQVMKRLGNPARFGFPVMVVLNANGEVLHIQDSSFLEEGKGYNKEKTLRFLRCWTPAAVQGKEE